MNSTEMNQVQKVKTAGFHLERCDQLKSNLNLLCVVEFRFFFFWLFLVLHVLIRLI